MTSETPIYEWAVAEVGDAAPPADHEVEREHVELYVKTSGDANPLYTDPAFAKTKGFDGVAAPVSMAMRIAPGRRATIMRLKGYRHPERPTPFARWECRTFAPVRPGDVITSESRLEEKFEKRGRKYLVWKVQARNQRGELVMEYRSTNSWEGAKPADRVR